MSLNTLVGHRSALRRLHPTHVESDVGRGAGFRRLSGGRSTCTFWTLGFRRSSFRHITRVPQRTAPNAWARPLVRWHAVVPFPFRAPGKPSDPGMSPPIPPRLTGDTTERLVAQTRTPGRRSEEHTSE